MSFGYYFQQVVLELASKHGWVEHQNALLYTNGAPKLVDLLHSCWHANYCVEATASEINKAHNNIAVGLPQNTRQRLLDKLIKESKSDAIYKACNGILDADLMRGWKEDFDIDTLLANSRKLVEIVRCLANVKPQN